MVGFGLNTAGGSIRFHQQADAIGTHLKALGELTNRPCSLLVKGDDALTYIGGVGTHRGYQNSTNERTA